MRQAQEELAELEEALSGYRRLSLGNEARRLEDELVALRIPLRSGVEAWLSGEGALQALAGEFARLQEHIDDVCDKEIEPLAAKGLTTPQEQADRIAVRVLDMLRYAIPLPAGRAGCRRVAGAGDRPAVANAGVGNPGDWGG